MADQINLLPHNATALERSLDIDRLSTLADPVRATMKPEEIDAGRLPWLAWGFNVDAWDDDWPIEVKRAVVRNSIPYHRAKGTLSGMRRAARASGGEIVRAVVPPSRVYAAPSLTADEREAFQKKYPELRVFRFRNRENIRRGSAPGFNLFASDATADHGDRQRQFVADLGARGRFGNQAFLVRNGQEIPLKTEARFVEIESRLAVDFTEVREPGVARGIFATTLRAGFYTVKHGARSRMYRMRIEQRFEVRTDRVSFNTVKPGLDPLGYAAQPVAQRGTKRGAHARGSYSGAAFSVQTNAETRLYSSLRLFDPDIPVERRGRSTHIGGARLGMPAYTAELLARIRGRRPISAQSRFVFGAFVATEKAPFENMVRTLAWAKSARDRVLLSTKTTQPVVASAAAVAGEIIAGSTQEVV